MYELQVGASHTVEYKIIPQIWSASLAFRGCTFGSKGEAPSLKDLLLFLPLLSKIENCLCGSVPHHAHCCVAGTMKDLFPLPSPSGNATGLGSRGAAETPGSWNQGGSPGKRNKGHYFACRTWSFIGGKWKPGVLAAHSPWVPIACLLKGFCRTFCTDTQTLQLNCGHCHVYSLLYLYFSSSCLLHTWGFPARPSFGPSGQHGTCRDPQSRRQCRIAAVDEVASGWHNDRPKETEYCHVAPYNGCRSPFFVTFSSCEKTTNFYLPLGIAFLFLGVLRQQVRKRYVHYGREVRQNRGFYHKVIALRLQCTQDGAN